MNEKTNNTEKAQTEDIFGNKEIPHTEKSESRKIEDSFRSVKIAKEIENMEDASIEYIDDVDVHYAIKNHTPYKSRHNDGSDSTLYVASAKQAILWKMEIAGQISDGIWENDDYLEGGEWEKFAYADVIVDDLIDKPRFEYEGSVESLQLIEKMYKDPLNGRMIFYIRMIEDRQYDDQDLWEDLWDLQTALNKA